MSSNQLFHCKACGAEVAKNAAVCPNCGAKLKSKHTLLWILLGLLAVILIIAIAGSSKDDSPKKIDEVDSGTKATEQIEQTTFKVGDKVDLNGTVATLIGVTESNGGTFIHPDDGNVYLVCEFEIENHTDREISISSLLDFKAYCDDYACNVSIGATMDIQSKESIDGTIAPGKKLNGVIGYEVPSDWKELEIHFTPDFWSSKKIVFIAEH